MNKTKILVVEDESIVVRVADNGCGMSEHICQLAFEPFYTTKEAGQGTGLGLAICKDIVDGAYGTIRVQSREGHGSTFTVSIPIV